MPKIINNIREKLLNEAKRQVFENGYSSMTIRSVASACNVGVGTVYNYFPSKDTLVASFMLTDWEECLKHIETSYQENEDMKAFLFTIYNELKSFEAKYTSLFHDENAESSYSGSFILRHKMLRGQIAQYVNKMCIKLNLEDTMLLSEFIAESMLTWTFTSYSFDEISALILRLI